MQSTSTQFLYGPFHSERCGKTIAVDITAPRDHLVVERGSNLARGSVIVTTCASHLIELSKAGEKVNTIAVVGKDEDPTGHPDLRAVTENLRALRDKWFPRAKLCIFTSVTDIDSYELRATLAMYNLLFFQYQWGTAKVFSEATGEKSTQLAELTKRLSGFDHLVVQANFYRGDMDNSTASEVTNWVKKLQEVQPQEVHILTGPGEQRKPVKAITKTRRQQIADEVAEKTGVTVSIHEDELVLS